MSYVRVRVLRAYLHACRYKLSELRAKLAELVEDEAIVEARRKEREGTFTGTGLARGGGGLSASAALRDLLKGSKARDGTHGGGEADGKPVVPEAIASALSSVGAFFQGGGGGGGGKGGTHGKRGTRKAKEAAEAKEAAAAGRAANAANAGAPSVSVWAKAPAHAAPAVAASSSAAPAPSAVAPPAAADVERLGAMAKSVLEHLHGRLKTAAAEGTAGMAAR